MKIVTKFVTSLTRKMQKDHVDLRFVDITIILLLGLLSLTWVENGLIISGGDFTFNFNPLRTFERFYSTWYDGVSTGFVNVQTIPDMITFQSFFAVSEMLGVPLFVAQKILFFFLFTAGGVSMYFLTTTILKGKERRMAGLISAFFYMLNPFTMVILWATPTILLFFYPVVPLILALYIKGLESRNTMLLLFLLCFFSSIVFSAAYSVATFAATTWLLIFSFFIFYIVSYRNDKLKIFYAFKFTVLLFIFWVALNSYWLLPYINNIQYISTKAVYEDSINLLKGTSSDAGLINTFRLFGYPPFNQKFMGIDLFYPYSPTYSTPIFIILSFFITILVFTSLLIKKKEKFYILYFSVFSLIVLFLFKGAQPPLGEIYIWLLKNFSLMTAFRNPLDKFGSLLPVGYSFLLGFTLAKIYHLSYDLSKFRRTIRFSILILCILIFVIFMFPFWTGQIFGKTGEIRPSWQVKVPDYYADASLWLAQQKESFRIYPIPLMNLFGTPFNWEHGHGGGDPRQFIFDKALLYDSNDLAKLVESNFTHGGINPSNEKSVARTLGLLNVKYVLVSEDIKESYFNIDKQSLLRSKSVLKKEEYDGIKFKTSFDKLYFYELSEEYYLPKIYSPTTLTYVEISNFSYGVNEQLIFATIPAAIFGKGYDIRNAIFIQNFDPIMIVSPLRSVFDKYKMNDTILDNKGSVLRIVTATNFPTPTLGFKRINPTKYRVIANGTIPFLLVFSESYDQNWKVYLQQKQKQNFENNKEVIYTKGTIENKNLEDGYFFETFLKTPVEESNHFKINGYANAWWIDPKQNNNAETEIIIEYAPQKLFYMGFGVSFIVFVIFLIYTTRQLIIDKHKRVI